MPEYPYHKSLRLQNFTVFKDTQFEFSPGVNAIIGENGSGKTHLLKAMYAYNRPPSRDVPDIDAALRQLFQTERVSDIVRSDTKPGSLLEVTGNYGDQDWTYAAHRSPKASNGAGFGDGSGDGSGSGSGAGFGDGAGDGSGANRDAHVVKSGEVKMTQPVFIPSMDMMGHTKGFREAYNSVVLDFDLTCYDILNLFNLKSRVTANGSVPDASHSRLTNLLGGEIVADDSSGRFFLKTATGRTDMPMVAEGLRKIASLVRLQSNNWLVPGSTLYWDEPEVNLNPILMQVLIESVLSLSRHGVQVFLTTHSYVVLKELDLQADDDDRIRFFSLQGNQKNGTEVSSTDDFTTLIPNSILNEYSSLYDRDLTRSTGRSRTGERIR